MWNKFDPDKGLPRDTVVLIFCDVSEILYWTTNLGSPHDIVKVFISQPMTGRTDEEITLERIKAISAVAKRYPRCYVMEIASFNKGALNKSDPITELGRCVSLMADAEVVVFCDGWKDSRGCNVEHEVAMQYSIPQIYI